MPDHHGLVARPWLAIATALAIVAAVAIVAGLFPSTISIAEIPERGNGVDDLWGRKFVAVEATEGGQPYDFREGQLSATFHLEGWVGFGSACGELGAEYRLDEGRLDWRGRPPTVGFLPCGGRRLAGGEWGEAFLAERPAWRLDGNTLELSSEFGTMTLVDRGEGSKPSEILGKRFGAMGPRQVGRSETTKLRANTWMSLSFDRDGTMRARLGCESVVVRTEVRTGWFRITEELDPKVIADCSGRMAAQETAWLWDRLDQPVQWQLEHHNSLVLKPHRSDRELFVLGLRYENEQRLTDPDLLAGKTFYPAPRDSLRDNVNPDVVIEVGEDGRFSTSAGFDRPSIHGTFRTGWIEFGQDREWSLSACENAPAEQRLGGILAREPAWHLTRSGELALWVGRRSFGFAEAENYEEIYGEPPPADGGDD